MTSDIPLLQSLLLISHPQLKQPESHLLLLQEQPRPTFLLAFLQAPLITFPSNPLIQQGICQQFQILLQLQHSRYQSQLQRRPSVPPRLPPLKSALPLHILYSLLANPTILNHELPYHLCQMDALVVRRSSPNPAHTSRNKFQATALLLHQAPDLRAEGEEEAVAFLSQFLPLPVLSRFSELKTKC